MPSNKNNVNIVLSLLVNFIKHEISADKVIITKTTSLHDLGLNALKGIMFIKKYSDEFKVNIDSLNFEYYFTYSKSNLKETIQPLT